MTMPGNVVGVDMHMHSGYSSDGEYAPRDLVRMAREAGLGLIALCDHNNVNGAAEALAAGAAEGVRVVPAVELDCLYENEKGESAALHVIGYGIDHTDSRFKTVWDDVERRERAASAERTNRVRALGIAVDDDKIAAIADGGIVICETIAEAAMTDPRNDLNPLLLPFRPGGARSNNPYVNFFWDYCSPGKPAYVHIEYMPLADCPALIRATGGKPVLAHPGQSLRGKEHLFPEIIGQGFSGIEVYSSYHSPADQHRWRMEAEKRGLAPTCGSDFHGRMKPAIRMGGHGADGEAMKRCADFFRDCVVKQ